LGVARAGDQLVSSLRKGGLLARIGEDHVFSTVDEAVVALAPSAPGQSAPGPSSSD
jgi:hypothetical protein